MRELIHHLRHRAASRVMPVDTRMTSHQSALIALLAVSVSRPLLLVKSVPLVSIPALDPLHAMIVWRVATRLMRQGNAQTAVAAFIQLITRLNAASVSQANTLPVYQAPATTVLQVNILLIPRPNVGRAPPAGSPQLRSMHVSHVRRDFTQVKLLPSAHPVSRAPILVMRRPSAQTVLLVSTQARMKQVLIALLVLLVSSLTHLRRPRAPIAPRANTQAVVPLHAQIVEVAIIHQQAHLHVPNVTEVLTRIPFRELVMIARQANTQTVPPALVRTVLPVRFRQVPGHQAAPTAPLASTPRRATAVAPIVTLVLTLVKLPVHAQIALLVTMRLAHYQVPVLNAAVVDIHLAFVQRTVKNVLVEHTPVMPPASAATAVAVGLVKMGQHHVTIATLVSSPRTSRTGAQTVHPVITAIPTILMNALNVWLVIFRMRAPQAARTAMRELIHHLRHRAALGVMRASSQVM